MYTAQDVMKEGADLFVGNTAAAEQHPLTPDFRFGGVQQEGSKNRLQDKKVLVYGGGDVWPKFIMAPLLHLGIKPENITLVDMKKPPEGLEWQYKDINVIVRPDPKLPLNGDSDYIKNQNFDFAIVATPPSAHESCAKEAIEHGLPVMIEKPIFSSTKEYDEFAKFCEDKSAHAYAIDWQRGLSTPLYAALGQTVPFSDSIFFTNKDEFAKLKDDEIINVRAIFTEGRGNALADIRHREHLLEMLKPEKWARTGMLADMGIHPINSITGAGFTLEKITNAFFGGASDKQGYRESIAHSRDEGAEAEMFARVDTEMRWNGKKIPVHFECAKGSAPNVNDGRTIIEYASGKKLVQEFGHLVNRISLYDEEGKTIATASDRGEPYERMFMEASYLFDKWKKTSPDQARIAYGAESREALRIVEESHEHACDHKPTVPKMRQYALDEMGDTKDAGEKAPDFKTAKIEVYKKVSSEEALPNSCQQHSTAEGVTFDQHSGCFYYVDIELGLLNRYNPKNDERTTWKLTSNELDEDGRPKQMLAVAKVNQDGSIIVMLSGGDNAGLNYFNPEKGELKHVGKIPEWEIKHPDNRPNDETTLTIDGKNYICYGTMDKHWNNKFDKNSCTALRYARTGAYYIIDPDTQQSHQITFDGDHPSPIITNGLADGGNTKDGKKILLWAETAEHPGQHGEQLNVYRGILDPQTFQVSQIEIFKSHTELGGSMNGIDTFGKPDGAKMAMYHDRPVYGISVLETGQIRFYYADPNDADYKKEALRIELPQGMTRNTQFALGIDSSGNPIGVVTTQDSGYFSRRWQVGDKREKAKDGLNGSVISFALPEGLTAHPQAIQRVDYPAMEQVLSTKISTISPLERVRVDAAHTELSTPHIEGIIQPQLTKATKLVRVSKP